jgi:hypothetical protein
VVAKAKQEFAADKPTAPTTVAAARTLALPRSGFAGGGEGAERMMANPATAGY